MEQIGFADVVILNTIDATSPEQRAEQARDQAIAVTADAPVQNTRNILRAEPENTMMLTRGVTIGGIPRDSYRTAVSGVVRVDMIAGPRLRCPCFL